MPSWSPLQPSWEPLDAFLEPPENPCMPTERPKRAVRRPANPLLTASGTQNCTSQGALLGTATIAKTFQNLSKTSIKVTPVQNMRTSKTNAARQNQKLELQATEVDEDIDKRPRANYYEAKDAPCAASGRQRSHAPPKSRRLSST